MDPERWQRIESLFLAAIERPPEERASFLATAAGSDSELRRQVEAMVAADEQPDRLELEAWLDRHAAAISDIPGLEGGSRVGPYRVAGLLGRGGMAEVYLAERDDTQYRQRVALKVIRHGIENDEVVRRFRVERQVLARLTHPNIARLLDGGVTAEGLPFLVMEHVDGRRITDYCAEHGLGVTERLALVETVCRAVHYAHQNLVVHRDLKPSNILVTADGAVRLLDFGIAKLLAPVDLALTEFETQTSVRLLTPEYASPEQLSGAPITTATDVHALGLLLFELLTGTRPFAAETGSRSDLEAAILSREPPRPSSVAATSESAPAQALRGALHLKPRGLRRRLRGDLDTIVLKALSKDPARRFQSAEQLADDLRRHRDGLPVVARPDTVAYRVGKFVRRHRFGVGVAAAGVLVLIGASLLTARQARVVARERDAARAERDKAREVTEFLFQLFEANPFSEGKNRDTMTLRELLEGSESEVRASFGRQPAVQATLYNLLARLQVGMGHLDRARTLAEEGLATRLRLNGERHAEVAESLDNLATVLQAQGEYDRAEQRFRQALAIREGLFGRRHTLVAESMNNLSGLLGERGDEQDREEEGALQRESLAIQRSLLGEDHLDVARSLNNLGVYLYQRKQSGDLAEAAALFRQALEIRRRHLGNDHPILANTLNNLANILHDQGELDAAERTFREAIRVWTAALGPDHPQLANGLYGLGELLEDRGDFAGAAAALSRSLAIDTQSLPPGHPYLEASRDRLRQLYQAWGRQPPSDLALPASP